MHSVFLPVIALFQQKISGQDFSFEKVRLLRERVFIYHFVTSPLGGRGGGGEILGRIGILFFIFSKATNFCFQIYVLILRRICVNNTVKPGVEAVPPLKIYPKTFLLHTWWQPELQQKLYFALILCGFLRKTSQ